LGFQSRPDLPALNTEDAAVAAGLAPVVGLEGRVMELQAALDSRPRELEEANKRRRDGADEPEVASSAAEVQVLQHQLGTVQERVSSMKDTMLALRFQAKEMQALEEFWKPVVLVPQRNNNKRMVHYCFFLSLFFSSLAFTVTICSG
jgi:TolA-binding protein